MLKSVKRIFRESKMMKRLSYIRTLISHDLTDKPTTRVGRAQRKSQDP